MRMLDGLAFSSGLAAFVGGALSIVTSRVMNAPNAASWAFLAMGGTFVVYNLDRLRDVERDRSTSPLRTRFILRNRRTLNIGVAIVSIGLALVLMRAPISIVLLCGGVGFIGLLHRRLKTIAVLKTIYVSVAWVAACVGIPWLASPRAQNPAWVSTILFASVAANLIASNLRDAEAADLPGRITPNLWVARLLILLAIGVAIAAPSPLVAFVWIPVWEGFALVRFQPSERYGHIAVDGALLVGAIGTAIHLAWLR